MSIWEKLENKYDRREILNRLSVGELKELAERNKISLEKRDWLGRTKTARKKEEIIDIIANSNFNLFDLIKMLGVSRLTKEELLDYMTIKQLRGLAKEYNISLEKRSFFRVKKVTRKGDMIDILRELSLSKIRRYAQKISLIKPLDKKIKKEETEKRKEDKTKDTEREVVQKFIERKNVDVIVREIKKYKPPPIRGKGAEKKLSIGLVSFLSHSFPDIEIEQPIARGARIDAIVEGKIGIEAKYKPPITEMDRLYGQIEKYLRRLDHVVVVFFETPSRDVRDFRNRIKRSKFAEKVTVLSLT